MPARVLYWFRSDLRLHDSPALQAAVSITQDAPGCCLYPVFCFDPHYVYSQYVGVNRWQFLLDSLQDLSNSISKINPSSKLLVVRGPPQTLLPALFKAWNISHLVFEEDDDAYTTERDAAVCEAARIAGVKVIHKLGHTLFAAKEVLAKHKNEPYTSYGPFVKLIETLPKPPRPTEQPLTLPSPGSTDLDLLRQDHSIESRRRADINSEFRDSQDTLYETFDGPNHDFGVPTSQELGLKLATSSHRGGETKALEILKHWLDVRSKEILAFEKPKTSPAAFAPADTTTLSPHLKFGTLSVRRFYWDILDLAKGKTMTKPPVSLLGQLYWREFFHQCGTSVPNFGQMRGNPICRYINWRLQDQYDVEGQRLPRQEMKFNDLEAEEHFAAWSEGRTGFPWIDAIMRQLIQEGWIHHLARHSVACFLTRGHLYISWERGAEVFDKYLVDWCVFTLGGPNDADSWTRDPTVNSGNWMWLAASAFFSNLYRVYSPIAFGKKWDPTAQLVRKYCPELADYPDKYIYEPWTAPIGIQQKAGCIIGKDYPKPIVKEKEAKAACLRKMQAAYQAKIYGNDPSVLDGTAPAPLAEAEAQLGPPAPVSGHKRKASGLEVAASDPKQQRLESMFSPKPKQTAQFASDESRM